MSMSYTEIYAFKRDGDAELYSEVKNAWRGAMAVWREMEDRYLPPYIPRYVYACNWYRSDMSTEEIIAHIGFKPSRCTAFSGDDTREIWNLADDSRVPKEDRIVLSTTFDGVLVKKENIPVVIAAFRSFGGETSLPEQADILQRIFDDPNYIAVGWNQTSVNADTWTNCFYDEETGEDLPYNCLEDKDHWWLFEEKKELL